MANTLGAKPVIDTNDFQNGIKRMNSELKVLESGFKASVAGMKGWESTATGLEGKIGNLTKRIEIQKEKVAITREEWERVKKEKGENSLAAEKLETKLNNETASLNNLEGELTQTQTDLAGLDQAQEESADSAEKARENTENFKEALGGVGAVVSGVMTVVAALAAAVAAVAVAVGGLVFSVAESSAELVDLSLKTGLTTEQLQEMKYVGEQLGTSQETITGSLARLTRSMAGAQDQWEDYAEQQAEAAAKGEEFDGQLGDSAAAFERLGVNVTDSTGQLRDRQEVFYDLIDALGKIPNEAERDALAMSLFGKSAMELNPLIKAGTEEMIAQARAAHEVGAVMSDENVAAFEAFDDSVASIKAGFKGLMGSLAVEFLPLFKQVADALQTLFKSEEFKAGVQEFIAALRPFLVIMGEALTQLLQGDLSGALTTLFGAENAAGIMKVFQTISDFIQNTLIPFVTTHAEEIKAALIGIGAALAAAGIVALIAGIVSAFNPVTAVIAAIVAAVGLLSAAWTGNWGGIRDTVLEIWATIQPPLQALWDWLSTNIPLALGNLSALWTNTLLPAITAVWGWLSGTLFPFLQALADFINAVFGVTITALAGIWQNILQPALLAVFGTMSGSLMPIFEKIAEFLSAVFQPIIEALSDWIGNSVVNSFKNLTTVMQSLTGWLDTIATKLNNLELPAWMTPGSPTPWEIGLLGVNDAMEQLIKKQLPSLENNLRLTAPGIGLAPVSVLGGVGGGSPISIGDIIINIPGTSATPQQIAVAAQDGVLKALRSKGGA